MAPAKLTAVVIAWASLGALSAAGKEIIDVKALPPQVQVEVVQKDGTVVKVVNGQPAQANTGQVATTNDPAEPPIQVEVSQGQVTFGRGARAGGSGQKAEVTSGARGTTIKLPTNGSYGGTAALAFKNSAPPMRFTVSLTGLQNYDLSSLTLSSGSLSLPLGHVNTSTTTKYFNARGQEQEGSVGAAYTLRAKREANGQVDVEVRRSGGAPLGKSVSITWQNNIENLKFGRLRGG